MDRPGFMIPPLPQERLDAIKSKFLDVPYACESPSQVLDIFLPEDGMKPCPVILHIHGGAFLFGTQRDEHLGAVLRGLERGYAVVSVQYRMSGEARFPALVWDCKAAVRWVRAHASEYGLDGGHIAAWGPSAGGYVAAMLGVTSGAPNPAFENPKQGNREYSSDVQAVVDWCGPAGGFLTMDAELRANGVGCPDHGEADSPESRLMGAKLDHISELAILAAPYRYAHKDMPPFIIIHGEADGTVPVQQSRTLAAAIAEAAGEARVVLKTYPGKGHHGEPWYEEREIGDICLDFLDRVL